MLTIKEKLQKAANKLSVGQIAMPVICFILTAITPMSSLGDMSLTALSIIIVLSAAGEVNTLCAAAGGLIGLGIAGVKDGFFIPYFLFLAVYVVSLRILKNDRLPLLTACAIFVLAKIVLLYNGYIWQYKGLLVIEVVAILFLPQVAKKAIALIKSSSLIVMPQEYIIVFTGLCLPVLALSGLDSHWVYPGAGLALALGWFFAKSAHMTYSVLAVLALLISLVDKTGFVALFGIFLLIYALGVWLNSGKWWWIYPFTLLISGVLCLIFIQTFNGVAPFGTAVSALLIYFCLAKFIRLPQQAVSEIVAQDKDYRQLLYGLQRLDKALNFLGNSAVDISKLNEKTLSEESIEDLVAQDVCRKCQNNTVCWQEKYSHTQEQFSKYASRIYWSGGGEFDGWFYSQCQNVPQLKVSFEENSRLLLTRKYIRQSQKNNQKLLQNAFLAVARTVGDLTRQSKTNYLVNTAYTMQMDKFLSAIKLSAVYCLCAQNPDKMTMSVYEQLNEQEIYRIKSKLESLYCCKFNPPTLEQQENEWVYTFYSTPMFKYDYAKHDSAYGQVNGDECVSFAVQDRLYLVLSDGMGTGALAAAESKTAISMAQSLLSAQISIKNTVEIVNLALNLKSAGESGASLDILCLNLYDGKCTITKAGAGESIVLHDKGVSRLYRDTLPLGILKEVKSTTHEFILNNGDTIILMSDGAQVLTEQVRSMYGHSCEDIVNMIMKGEDNHDDKTVAAIQLKI
ncbi:MAG: SpoIIE family protein phosphatase [Oscillospiraceae bacterium]